MENTARQLFIIEPTISLEPKKLKVAGYARVSSDSDDQLNSFSAQVKNYTSYITQNKDWEFVDVYADEGISGVSLNKRDDFNRMITDCRNGKIDRIVTKSSSRFGRNTVDALTILRELKELGISVFFEKENIDTEKISSELLITLYSLFAQQESLAISQNCKKGNRMRMADGTYVSSNPPYGYRLKNKQLIIYEPEAEIVQIIFQSYINGESSTAIANKLNSIPTPKKSCMTVWRFGSVLNILKNERYKGDTLLQKSYREDELPYTLRKNNGQLPKFYVKNTHKAIITELQFELVAQLIKLQKPKKDNTTIEHPLNKKIICSECGTTYRKKLTKKGISFVCRTHDINVKFCSSIPITEQSIYNSFIRLYNKLKLNYKYILEPYLQGLEKLSEISNSSNIAISTINKQIADTAEQINVMNGLLESGILDSAIFIPQNDELNKKLRNLKLERSRLLKNNDSSNDIQMTEEVIDVLENAPKQISEFNESLFSDLIKEIHAHDDKEIEFVLNNNIILKERL